MTSVRLPRNVQFMYEHALALAEFEAGFSPSRVEADRADPWSFELELDGSTDEFISRSAYAGYVDGRPSVYAQLTKPKYQGGEYNRTRSVNQYLTHWIYPYKGKFHPQLVRAILNIIRLRPGALVLDPFVGSGTTILECQLLGLNAIGVDVSPLCVMLSRVKTQSYKHITSIGKAVERVTRAGLSHPDELDPSEFAPQTVAEFVQVARMVTYSDIANRARDPRRYLQRNLASMFDSAKTMARAKRRFRLRFGSVDAKLGDARDLCPVGIRDASIDGIVTSPPYSIALDYVKNDAHALKVMGYDLDGLRQGFVGVRGGGPADKLQKYNADLKASFTEMARVLKPGASAVVVIGDATVDGKERTTTEEMIGWAAERGLRLQRSMPKIVWGLYNVVADEKILFFVRE